MDRLASLRESDVIPPSDPVFGEQTYDDDTFPSSNIMQNHIPSINTDTSDPLSHLSSNTRSPVSIVHPGSSSIPRLLGLLAVTRPIPAATLSPSHAVLSPLTPVSPFGSESQHPPWPIPIPGHFDPRDQFQPELRGPIVPQKRYKPHTSSDRRRYVDEAHLGSILFYMQKPYEGGIPLKDAMHDHFRRLVSHYEPMFQERDPSISVIINWPGYQPWSCQIPTRDFRDYPPRPITRAKLAKNVAKNVARFIAEQQGCQMDEDGDPAWLVGPGKIDVFDLVLVRLDQVSMVSWQAVLQLIRPLS